MTTSAFAPLLTARPPRFAPGSAVRLQGEAAAFASSLRTHAPPPAPGPPLLVAFIEDALPPPRVVAALRRRPGGAYDGAAPPGGCCGPAAGVPAEPRGWRNPWAGGPQEGVAAARRGRVVADRAKGEAALGAALARLAAAQRRRAAPPGGGMWDEEGGAGAAGGDGGCDWDGDSYGDGDCGAGAGAATPPLARLSPALCAESARLRERAARVVAEVGSARRDLAASARETLGSRAAAGDGRGVCDDDDGDDDDGDDDGYDAGTLR